MLTFALITEISPGYVQYHPSLFFKMSTKLWPARRRLLKNHDWLSPHCADLLAAPCFVAYLLA